MPARPSLDLRAYPWEQCYATSDLRPDGKPVDILRDFYIPALSRATRDDGVAGYFTSTSLAAASQVFSRFVEQSGKARFVDGLQLTPEDAEAILQGHQHRAAEPMLAALGGGRVSIVRAPRRRAVSPKVACLGYSGVAPGILCAYRWQSETQLRTERFSWVSAA